MKPPPSFAAAASKYVEQPVVIDGLYFDVQRCRWPIREVRLGPPVDTGRSIFDDIYQ